MAKKPLRILTLSEGASTGDGTMVKFRIEVQGGKIYDFEIGYDKLPDLFQYLAFVAEDASKKRTGGQLVPFEIGGRTEASYLPATHLGIVAADVPGKGLLVVRNFDFDLGFLIDEDKIRALLTDAPRIAEGLGAANRKPH